MDLEKSIATSQGTFLIRPYKDEDEQDVLDLWELAFGHKLQPEMLRWKFQANPFGRHIMLCINRENKPVVMYSGIRYPANWLGREVTFTHLMDNMSHPGYREMATGRKGLFIQTAEHYISVYGRPEESVYHYGFPGPKHFKLGKIFLKYQYMAPVQYLQTRIAGLRSSWLHRTGRVTENPSAGAAFDDLWLRATPWFPFTVRRSAEFLNWRFFQHPVNRYRVFSNGSQTGGMSAYVVIFIAGEVATVVDMLCLPKKGGLPEIFRVIKKELLSSGVTIIRTWLPKNHFTVRKMFRLGFRVQPEPLGFVPCERGFVPELNTEFTHRNLYYTMADGDLL